MKASDEYDGRKEEHVLFNDALNTFYIRVYGIRHMVRDHSDSERGNPLHPHRLLLLINSKVPVRSLETHTEREGNGLFNDALNTFYIRVYGIRHMVRDHSDSERGNPLHPHRLLLLINSKVPVRKPGNTHREREMFYLTMHSTHFI